MNAFRVVLLAVSMTCWAWSPSASKFQSIPNSFEPMTDEFTAWEHRSNNSKPTALILAELDLQQRSEKLGLIFNHPLPSNRVVYDKKLSRLVVRLTHGQASRVKLSDLRKISQKSEMIETFIVHPPLEEGYQNIELTLSQPIVFSPHIPSAQPWKLNIHLARKPKALH